MNSGIGNCTSIYNYTKICSPYVFVYKSKRECLTSLKILDISSPRLPFLFNNASCFSRAHHGEICKLTVPSFFCLFGLACLYVCQDGILVN